MLHSMTAFARYEQRGAWGALHWEMRSVNNRYLDVQLRLPDELRGMENWLREQLSVALKRGKVELGVRLDMSGLMTSPQQLDEHALGNLSQILHRLQQLQPQLALPNQLDVLRWPGVLVEQRADLSVIESHLKQGFEPLLADFIATRQREGERLSLFLHERLTQMQQLLQQLRGRRHDILPRLRERLHKRLTELALSQIQPDEVRLEQELVIQANRLDVDEELDRLESHLVEIHQTLRKTEPVGRRLDFLMQELNREANTLSSKSADSETTLTAVEMKVLIEQMREQIQNLE